MDTTLLTARDLGMLLRELGPDALMDRLIDRLRDRLRDFDPELNETRARDGFRYDKPALGLLEWMPTREVGGPVVVKMVGYHPTNPLQRNLPSVLATTSMWDSESGHLMAIADATLLTAIRTGAVSALATEVLARSGPITVGVIGLGAQAVTQVHALSRVRRVDRVLAYDTDDTAAASFADRIDFAGIPVEVMYEPALGALVASSDVLCTCTSVGIGEGPVIPLGVEHRPWLHINAVGADFPGKIEIPSDLIARATLFPDLLAQCLAEGECQAAPPARIGPELPELIRTPSQFSAQRDRLTVFDSTGWALEDEIALSVAVESAAELGLGTRIVLESIPTHPLDPYSLSVD